MYSSSFKKYLFGLATIALLASCTYHNEEELYPKEGECIEGEMSYSKDIEPILTNYGCLSCHPSAVQTKLNNHSNILISVNNGKLLGSITHESGFKPMPKGQSKMDACSIEKIKKWIEEGAKNN